MAIKKPKYISDDEVTIRLQGLLWVRKQEYQGTDTHFYLKWAYDPQEITHTYRDMKKRDLIYSRISGLLTV